VVVARETIELAFLAAIQHLPTRQRAVLILRDVLGWSAKETGAVLDTSETAVKSALQRARATLRVRLPPGRSDWSPPPQATESELAILRRYITAHEADDHNALAAVLSEDVRVSYPPQPLWRDSRDSFIASSSQDAPPGEYRFLTTRANNQPAVAIYLRQPEATTFQLIALEVIRIDHDRIVEIVDFDPRLVPASSLPVEL
jgi:RNA polymerase sigma-70 factor (ECF subfamily)